MFGLVEAGTSGWASPVTVSALAVGLVLVGALCRSRGTSGGADTAAAAPHPPTRSSANISRALLYAGFYGLFYFMGQFLQDVEGYSPLLTGLAFLPMPASVFLSSQLASRFLFVPALPKGR